MFRLDSPDQFRYRLRGSRMKIRQTYKIFAGCIMLALCVYALSAAAQQSPAPASAAPFAGATVADVKGKVRVQLPRQAPSNPARGQVLPPETRITTEKGDILLRLSDASQ